jgi:hypothetical protein
MIHINLVASILRNAGFPASIQRNSDLESYIAVQFSNRKRMVTTAELAIVLDDLIEDGLVSVKSIGGVGIVNVIE